MWYSLILCHLLWETASATTCLWAGCMSLMTAKNVSLFSAVLFTCSLPDLFYYSALFLSLSLSHTLHLSLSLSSLSLSRSLSLWCTKWVSHLADPLKSAPISLAQEKLAGEGNHFSSAPRHDEGRPNLICGCSRSIMDVKRFALRIRGQTAGATDQQPATHPQTRSSRWLPVWTGAIINKWKSFISCCNQDNNLGKLPEALRQMVMMAVVMVLWGDILQVETSESNSIYRPC